MIIMSRSATHFRGWIASVVLALCCPNVWSTDYFVSARGSDAANGLAADFIQGSSSTGPFATLAPLTKLSLQHGDRILLACGQRFQGPLRLSLQSTQLGQLAISRYGSCPVNERPVVDGRVLVEGLAGTGLKTIKQETPVVQVFSGDKPMARARFPKDGYLIFPAGSASAVDHIPAHSSLSGKDLLGAVVHARTQEWLIEEKKVSSAEGQLESSLRYPLRPKAGLYLTGKAWIIGEDDGWAYDNAWQSLHVRNKTLGPISVVHASHLLQIEGRGAVSIAGIAFNAAGGDAINLKLDGVVNINDVLITRAAGNGISVSSASYAQITNSYIEDTALDGIFFADVARAVVRRNAITNAGLYLGPGPSLAAINAHRTQAATIEENEVLRSAYIGIRFAGDARVRGNIVESACLLLSDCGAIYTWRRGIDDVRPPVEVSGNAVINVNGDTTVKFGVNDWFAGIYLDEWTRAATVRGNLIAKAGQGIYLHNARNNVVESNYILGARYQAIIEKDDAPALIGVVPVSGDVANRLLDNTDLKVESLWSVERAEANLLVGQQKYFFIFATPSKFAEWAPPFAFTKKCVEQQDMIRRLQLVLVAFRSYQCNANK